MKENLLPVFILLLFFNSLKNLLKYWIVRDQVLASNFRFFPERKG